MGTPEPRHPRDVHGYVASPDGPGRSADDTVAGAVTVIARWADLALDIAAPSDTLVKGRLR